MRLSDHDHELTQIRSGQATGNGRVQEFHFIFDLVQSTAFGPRPEYRLQTIDGSDCHPLMQNENDLMSRYGQGALWGKLLVVILRFCPTVQSCGLTFPTFVQRLPFLFFLARCIRPPHSFMCKLHSHSSLLTVWLKRLYVDSSVRLQ